MRRSAKSIKKIYWIQFAIGGVLLILLMVLLVVYRGGLQSYEPDEETVQYIMGKEIAHDDKAVYSHNEGELAIKDKSGEGSVECYPIIHKGNPNRKITISENMLYTNPNYDEGCSRLNYFTSIELDQGLAIIEKDKKRTVVSGGYLFNGVNTYILLEDSILEIGVNKVKVPALSYVIANYRNDLELYNSETRAYEYYFLGGSDSFINVDDKYTIDVGRDVIIKDGRESLIFTAVDGLDVLTLE